MAPGLFREHIIAPTTQSFFGQGLAAFIAALFAGLFVGTMLFGFVADRFGRRTIFTISLLWYSAASIVMAFQTDATWLYLWRFLAGVGIGVELVTIDTYISELVPRRNARPRLRVQPDHPVRRHPRGRLPGLPARAAGIRSAFPAGAGWC